MLPAPLMPEAIALLDEVAAVRRHDGPSAASRYVGQIESARPGLSCASSSRIAGLTLAGRALLLRSLARVVVQGGCAHETGVLIGMVYIMVLYVVLTLHANMRGIDIGRSPRRAASAPRASRPSAWCSAADLSWPIGVRWCSSRRSA